MTPVKIIKRCATCREMLSIGLFFKSSSKPDGLRSRCKSCDAIKTKRYRDNNREKVAAMTRAWRTKNPELVKKYKQAERLRNKESIRERKRKEYIRSRTIIIARTKAWKLANPDRSRAHVKQYEERNPFLRSAISAARRTRISGNGGKFTQGEWVSLCAEHEGHCLSCGVIAQRLYPDHVLPVARGGHSNISNIQPLCGPCNRRKGTKFIDYRKERIAA